MDNESIIKELNELITRTAFLIKRVDARSDEFNKWTQAVINNLMDIQKLIENTRVYVPLPRN